MDMAAIMQESFAASGIKTSIVHTPKTIRVEDADVEGGFYEYLSSDVTVTLEDGTVMSFSDVGMLEIATAVIGHIKGKK